MTETKLVQFNCPRKVLKDFDETWKRIGRYRDRTHALLTTMEFFIEENQENGEQKEAKK